MAYLMQNGVNLGPVIEVTSLPTGTDINKHAVYRLIHYDDPFVIPEEYRSSYHGLGLGFIGTGYKYVEREIVEEELIEEGFIKPEISEDGVKFPEAEEGWEPQNVFGWHSWESMATIAAGVEYIHGFFTPGWLDDDDNDVVAEFSLYWDHNTNTVAFNYGTDTPQGPKVCDGFYIWDGKIMKQIDYTPVEMVGASFTADGASGLTPQPLKQNGFSALLSDGTFGFPETTTSTFYGTGGQCGWDSDPDYWGLIGRKYNDKATGGYVSYDCPTHPMLSIQYSGTKECLLHIDMQWNGTTFYVMERATPITNTGSNSYLSPITYYRTGKFTKSASDNLSTSHFTASKTSWSPWYSAYDNQTFYNKISNPSSIDTIGRYRYVDMKTYEDLNFAYTTPCNFNIPTAAGTVGVSKGLLTTEVVADSYLLSNNLLRVKQTVEVLDTTKYTTTAKYSRYGLYSTTSGSGFIIDSIWSSITWDAQWTPDTTAKVMSLTKTQYNALTTKDPSTIYVVNMQA